MSAVPFVERRAESDELERFLDDVRGGSRCLLLEGEVGIGKTTLLNRARELASERGYRVLSADPIELEVPSEFAALADLLDGLPEATYADLPGAQRRAVEVGVFRAENAEGHVDARTLATAVLGLLRRLAATSPVVLAIDDLPWLDLPSARVIASVLRRTGPTPIALVGTVRLNWSNDAPALVTDALDRGHVRHLTVGPISFREMGRLLAGSTTYALSRATLARIYELSRGNPMFALELLNENTVGNVVPPDLSLSVPDSLRRLVRNSIDSLPDRARDLILIAALSAEPSVEQLLRATRDEIRVRADLQRAIDIGVVRRNGDLLVFAHPLFRSVVTDDATVEQRRGAHRRLAAVVGQPEARARHLALGSDGPDEDAADEVEGAALSAAARGASEAAAMLAQLAVSLTPRLRADDRRRRMVIEADARFQASEPARATELLEAVVDAMAPGPRRAELLRRLARYAAFRGDPLDQWVARLRSALDEVGKDLALQAAITFDLGTALANAGDRVAADEYGARTLQLAALLGDVSFHAQVSAGMAFHRFVSGQGIERDLVERALSGGEPPLGLSMELRPRVVVAHLLHWSDDLEAARVLYEVEYERASEEGIETGLPLLLCTLAETEAWSGNWQRATELAEQGCELAEDAGSSPGLALMLGVRALVRVYRGHLDEGVRDSLRAVSIAQELGFPPAVLIAAQALGLAGLSTGDAAAAHGWVGPIADMVRATGVAEPGMLRFLPDEIEALILLGDLDSAAELLDPFEARSLELGRRWGVAAAARCRGLLLASQGDLAAAQEILEPAIVLSGQLTMPFELARTFLVAGEVLRRARQEQRSVEAFRSAADLFEKLGAPLWLRRANEELG